MKTYKIIWNIPQGTVIQFDRIIERIKCTGKRYELIYDDENKLIGVKCEKRPLNALGFGFSFEEHNMINELIDIDNKLKRLIDKVDDILNNPILKNHERI